MGTDIHVQVEIFHDGRWHWFWEGMKHFKYIGYHTDPFDLDRDYDLFAMLADVRNGYGFGGCDTGDGFIPVSEPKGLPEDISPELDEARDHGKVYLGDHSFSYLSLAELKEYKERAKEYYTNKRGVVGINNYKIFKEKGEPDGWSGSVGGMTIVHVENETMDKILSGEMEKEEGKKYYTTVEWKVNYMESKAYFWEDYLEILGSLHYYGDNLGDSDIRMVFGFDS